MRYGENQRDGRGGDADAALLLRDRRVRVAHLLLQVPRLLVGRLDEHVHQRRLSCL